MNTENNETNVDESQMSLDEIADKVFNDANVGDGEELFVDESAPLSTDQEEETPESETEPKEEPQEESEKTQTMAQQEERLYAGRFKTAEELEQAFLKSQETQTTEQTTQPQTPTQDTEEVPDLEEREFITLKEQDDADGTNYTEEYLSAKMKERDLTDFELESIEGTPLATAYIAEKTRRDVMSEVEPVLNPLREDMQKKQAEAYVENEKAIVSQTEKDFGSERFKELQDKAKDAEFMKELTETSSVMPIIEQLWNSGQKALANRMILQEIDMHSRRKEAQIKQGKASKSIPADIGSTTTNQKKILEKASSMEEAWDASMQELS